jgi:Cu/Ag efflux protein CusF
MFSSELVWNIVGSVHHTASTVLLFQTTMTALRPFVYWAQTESNVSLKVDLKDVKVTLLLSDLKNCVLELLV